jgi:hypothetical protein
VRTLEHVSGISQHTIPFESHPNDVTRQTNKKVRLGAQLLTLFDEGLETGSSY